MRFYRVAFRTPADGSRGFDWFTSKRQADKAASEFLAQHNPEQEATAEVECFDITPTRQGIASALRRYAEHPDNG